jgi:hypothetical protein
MPAAPQTHHGRSFVDALLVRCAERPWRMFAIMWFVLILASGALALFGLDHRSMPVPVLQPEGIPYHRYIHDRKNQRGIGYDPSMLPAYDATKVNAKCSADVVVDASGEPRLHANFFEVAGSCGWPRPSFGWMVFSAWDVTDPTHFERCIPANVYRFLLHDHGLQLAWENDARNSLHSFTIELPGALVQLALPQFLAAGFVLSFGALFKWRVHRRSVRRRCTECGQQLDPQIPCERCPECGHDVAELVSLRDVLTWWFPHRAGARLRLGIVLIAIVAWIVIQLQSSTEAIGSLFPSAWISVSTESEVADTETITTTLGWPTRLVQLQRQDWYEYRPSQGLVPLAAQRGSSVSINATRLDLEFERGRPSELTTVTLFWPWILLHASIFILLAALLAGIEWFVRLAFWRKPRAQHS